MRSVHVVYQRVLYPWACELDFDVYQGTLVIISAWNNENMRKDA